MSDHDRFHIGGIVNKQIAALVVATVMLTGVTLADAQQRQRYRRSVGLESAG